MKKAVSIIIIVVLLGAIGGLAYLFISNNKAVKVPDFSSSNVTEVQEWCDSLEDHGCSITYEYNNTIGENMVVYQSIKADEKLESDISFIISKGIEPSVTVPTITDTTTKSDIVEWVQTNGLTDVVYEEEASDTIAENNVIRIESSDSPITVNSLVTVYISTGKAADATTDTTTKTEDGIVVEGGTYVGLTLEQFKTKVEALKLVATHKESRDAYSDTVTKGDIVWHGSGTYEENENISYGLSLGKKDSTSEDDLDITKGEYVGLTETEFKEKATTLKLSAYHKESKDAYSDTVAKGSIVWHGSGTYVEDETWNYGLSLGKESEASTTSEDDLEVYRTEYLGLTETAFKEKATALKLVANHKESKDAYSDTVAKGNIVWHGYGTYVEGETWNYGLSLGKSDSSSTTTTTTTRTTNITVTKGSYVGLTVSEFETKMKALGFESIKKTTDYEAYSDTVAAGNVIWHGSGTYTPSETSIRYSVSKGPKTGEVINNSTTVEKVTVDGSSYLGKTVSELKTYCTGLGLTVAHNSAYDSNSSTVTEGNIVKYDSGSIAKNSTVYYGQSLGIATATLLPYDTMNSVYLHDNFKNVSTTETTLNSVLKTEKGFTNITYKEVSSDDPDDDPGMIMSVKANGVEVGKSTSYALDTAIVIEINNS